MSGSGTDKTKSGVTLAGPVVILVEPQLDGGRYIISVRAGVRRGKLPSSLRALLFWTDDWQRVSKWYSWSLPV